MTKKHLKIFLNGVVISNTNLSDADAVLFRSAGESVGTTQAVHLIIEGVIVGLVVWALSEAYDDFQGKQICKRAVASAWVRMAGDAQACSAQGGVYMDTNRPSEWDCGASASGYCSK